MEEKYEMIMEMPLEKLILLGIRGVHYNSYIQPDVDKYFDIADMCKYTRDVNNLNDFEMNYAVNIINLVLDGEE